MTQKIDFLKNNEKANFVALVPFNVPDTNRRIQPVVVIAPGKQKAWVTFCNLGHHYNLKWDFSKEVKPLTLDGAKFQLAGMTEWTDLNKLWTEHQKIENRTCKSKELEKTRIYLPAIMIAVLLLASYGTYRMWDVTLEGMSLPGGPAICPRPSNS